WEQIAAYGTAKRDWFARFLTLPNGIPSHDTFYRVFAALNPEAFAQRFGRWMAAACEATGLYKGRTLQVQILTEGFAFEGRIYPSLSAVAKPATGSHCNGYLFFRSSLNQQEEKP